MVDALRWSGWVSVEEVRRPPAAEVWRDAAGLDDETLDMLLAAAARQCDDFAPPPAVDGDRCPESFRTAHLMQARALARSFAAGGGDRVGGELGVTVFPMDWSVKALLRPRRAVGGIA